MQTEIIESMTRAPARSPARAERMTIGGLIDSAAADWRVGRAAIIAVFLLPFLVLLTGVGTALAGKEAYKWFVAEDHIAENLQAIAFGLSGALAIMIGLRLRRSYGNVASAAYLVVGLALLWVTGEELSWGQRIFGIETPDTLLEVNRQGELNLHNIYPIEHALRVAQIGVGLWGGILPIVLFAFPGILRRWRSALELAVPHYSLVIYFGCTAAWRLYRYLGPEPPQHLRFAIAEWSEVIELILALGVLFFMVYQLRRLSASRPQAVAGAPRT